LYKSQLYKVRELGRGAHTHEMLSRQAATLSKIPRFLCNTQPLTKMKKRENFPPTSTCVRHVVCVIFSRQSTRWVESFRFFFILVGAGCYTETAGFWKELRRDLCQQERRGYRKWWNTQNTLYMGCYLSNFIDYSPVANRRVGNFVNCR